MPTKATNASALTRVVKLTGNLPPFLQGRYGYLSDLSATEGTRQVSVCLWGMTLQMNIPQGAWQQPAIDEAARMDYALEFLLNRARGYESDPLYGELYRAGRATSHALVALTSGVPAAFALGHLALWVSAEDYGTAMWRAGHNLNFVQMQRLWQEAVTAAEHLTQVEQQQIG